MKNLVIILPIVLAVIIIFLLLLPASKEPSKQEISQKEHFKHHNLLLINKEIINKPAPDFELLGIDSEVYSLKNFRGKNVLLFFNEGVMCYPSCWQQMVALTKDKRFETEKTIVLSIIVDSPEEWKQAIQKMPELKQAIVLFDVNKSASKNFGMLNIPSSMHPGLYPGHSYVIIDKEGIVRYILDDPDMGIRNDFLLQEIRKINEEQKI
ncbi:MAG: hypothetical protein KatS3mg097_640 [Candidatus Parcubacteria bacterium]|nr:MAG: hypothetical protein KatS3mg097_640 [Candidatus Parcubacteria bacterium]